MTTLTDSYRGAFRTMQKKAQKRSRASGRKNRPGLFAVLLRMAVLGVIFLSLTAGALFGLQYYFQKAGIMIPGIWIGDQDVSGLTPSETAALVENKWNQTRLVLVDSEDTNRTWAIPAGDLGLRVNGQATAEAAYSAGHGGPPLENLVEILLIWRSGILLQPHAELDAAAAQEFLAELSNDVDIPPVEAVLVIENGVVTAEQGEPGRKMNIEKTIAALAESPLSFLQYGFIPLTMEPWQPQITDISDAADAAEAYLGSGMHVRAYDPVSGEMPGWNPTRAQIGEWLQIQPSDSGFEVLLRKEAYTEEIQAWADSLGENRVLDHEQALEYAEATVLGSSPAPPVITYTPTTWQVGAGESLASIASQVGIPAWKILEYNPSLSGTGLVRASSITIPPADANLELPVVTDKRIEVSISDQRMLVYENQELIHEFVISTGIDDSPTMPGVFQVLMHEINAYGSRWDLYMPHFLGIYEALPGFTNGIHGLPMLSNGQRLWASVLGQPASYGCIILDLENAEWLYGWADDGVVVEITR